MICFFFYILQADQTKAGKSWSQFIERSRELRKSNVASPKIVCNKIVASENIVWNLAFSLTRLTYSVYSSLFPLEVFKY